MERQIGFRMKVLLIIVFCLRWYLSRLFLFFYFPFFLICGIIEAVLSFFWGLILNKWRGLKFTKKFFEKPIDIILGWDLEQWESNPYARYADMPEYVDLVLSTYVIFPIVNLFIVYPLIGLIHTIVN